MIHTPSPAATYTTTATMLQTVQPRHIMHAFLASTTLLALPQARPGLAAAVATTLGTSRSTRDSAEAAVAQQKNEVGRDATVMTHATSSATCASQIARQAPDESKLHFY